MVVDMIHAGRLLTLTRAARLFRVPSPWLRREADAGRMPCLRAGSRLLFDAEAVEEELLTRARRKGAS